VILSLEKTMSDTIAEIKEDLQRIEKQLSSIQESYQKNTRFIIRLQSLLTVYYHTANITELIILMSADLKQLQKIKEELDKSDSRIVSLEK
jgi:hypothetical protein